MISILILILPGVMGVAVSTSFPKVKDMKVLDIREIAFNINKKIAYAASSRSLYILDSYTGEVKKKIDVLNSSYPSIYHISGIGFNSKTDKLYIAAWPDKIIIMNANNYNVIKTIRTSSITRPYYGVSNVYVDTNTDMIYVKVLNQSAKYNYIPLYAVINGRNNTLSGFINYGALDFIHNEIWIWSKNIDNYTLIIKNLNNGIIKKEIVTPIPQVNASWEKPSMHVFGEKLYIKCPASGEVLVYDTNNYKLLHRWKNVGVEDLSAYDQKNNVIYGIFTEWINSTSSSAGIRAINADTGKIVAEIKNMSYSNLMGAGGKLSILGIDQSTHLLYVTVQKKENSPTYLMIYNLSSEGKNAYPSYSSWIIVGVIITVAVLLAALYVYTKKHK